MKLTKEKESRELHVVGAAIVRDGRCLATRRGPGQDQAGLWEFPGGKVEDDESAAEALERELAEELGVRVEVGRVLATGRADVRDVEVVLNVYLATIDDGAIELREHDRASWLGPEELWRVEWAEADIPAVEALESHFRTIDGSE